MSPAHPSSSPQLSRFRLLAQLGHGAQGAIYEAFDLEAQVRVALKTIALSHADRIVRFKNEFRALRDLRHPNLVQLYDLIEDNGQWLFTMEIVDGVDFTTWVRGPKPPDADASLDDTAVLPAPTPTAQPETPGETPGHGDRRPVFDERRLRDGLRSLVAALAHIHRAGKVHRDVKPSNVLVDARGRLVLIDFGIVAELADQGPDAGLIIGTSAYMAPEQARGEAVGPAADWYAVGALLFEALTGRPPFRGASAELMRLKCCVDAPAPSLFVDGLPADLERLCTQLLQREAAARPSAEAILALLGVEREPLSILGEGGAAPSFVGRQAELARLTQAFADVEAGEPRALVLEGPSGVGKSALVAHFVAELRQRRRKLLVLRGRCHEQERVPYNALDAVVDGLARFLAARSIDKVQPLLPPGAAALGRLFPVLTSIEPIAQAVLGHDAPGVASRERGEAVAALRELLTRVARSRPTVMLIDDLQWADTDSVVLLQELLRAPAPSLLFVATARPAGATTTALWAQLERLPLRGLSAEDAGALATALLQQHGLAATPATAAVLDEARGHPLFLDELVRHLAGHAEAHAASLNDVIRARAGRLPAAAQALLHVVAAAGLPVGQRAAAQAAALAPAEYATALTLLRSANFVRINGTRRDDTIEPWHDRVRESIYAGLPAGERAAVHRRLGTVLAEQGAGSEALFHHFEQAGDAVTAARHARAAAQAAARALAFDRAAELYRRALALGRPDDDERRQLWTALGDAETNGGRPQAAAAAFDAAAATIGPGADEALRAQLLDLRRRATEQLLMGGHLEAGLAATRTLLGELGLSLPESGLPALSRIVYRQARLTLKPLRWTRRRDADLDADTRALLDVYWSVGAGLSLVDTVRGTLFALAGALAALDRGDELRIARVLAMAAISEAGLGSRWRALRLVDACRRAANSDGSERARFYGTIAQHASAFLLDNDWPRCLGGFEQALALWRATGRTLGWESDAAEQFACWSLDNMGRLREVLERVPARVRAAQRDGNRFMEVNFRAFFANVHLVPDWPAEGRRDVEDAIASWLPGRDEFGNQHYLAQRSRTYIALYAGELDDDAVRLDAGWRRFGCSLMRHVVLLRQDGLMLTSGLALARAVEARARGDERQAARRARQARRDLAALARIPLPMAQSAAARRRAGLAAFDGDDEGALELLHEALALAERGSEELFAAALRRRLGALVGGSEGAKLTADGERWMAREGIRRPDRMTAALVPGWRHPG